jgi:hypothetical protein
VQRFSNPAADPVLSSGRVGAGNPLNEEPMEPLLNLEQAGQLLGLNRNQMAELCRERSQMRRKVRLPVIRIGKRCLFRAEALRQWVVTLEQGGGQ